MGKALAGVAAPNQTLMLTGYLAIQQRRVLHQNKVIKINYMAAHHQRVSVISSLAATKAIGLSQPHRASMADKINNSMASANRSSRMLIRLHSHQTKAANNRACSQISRNPASTINNGLDRVAATIIKEKYSVSALTQA